MNEAQISKIKDDPGHPLSFLWFDIGEAYGIGAGGRDDATFASRKMTSFPFLRGFFLKED